MTTTALKMLAAALLIASPASLGLATYSDQVAVPLLEDDASAEEAEVIASYAQDYEANLTTGELDLRIDEGEVRVVGWANDSVSIEVLQTPTDDDRTKATIQDDTAGEHLNLSVVVDRQERTGVSAEIGPLSQGDDDPERAIVAYVPMDVAYQRVYACEGETSAVSQTIDDALDRLPGTEEHEREACVPADGQPETGGTIGINSGRDDPTLDVTAGVFDLHGDALELSFDDADLGVDRVDFAMARISTDNGDVTGTSVTLGDLKATTDNGDVDLSGSISKVHATTDNGDVDLRSDITQAALTTDNGQVTVVGSLADGTIDTDNGDVILQLEPRASGSLDVTTDNGDVAVTVPEAQRYGYDVEASTDNGDIVIGLEDVRKAGTTQGNASEDDHREDRDRVHARTHGFDSREIQLGLSLATDNGDVWVTDASDAVDDREDEDDGDDGNTGTTLVRTPGSLDAVGGAR